MHNKTMFSSPIQTVLSVLDSHQIMPYGSRTCPLRGITVGREFFPKLPAENSEKSPCPEEHYLIYGYILLLAVSSVN